MVIRKIISFVKKSYQKIKESFSKFFNWIYVGIKSLFLRGRPKNESASQNDSDDDEDIQLMGAIKDAIKQNDLSLVKNLIKDPATIRSLHVYHFIDTIQSTIKDNKTEIAKLLINAYSMHAMNLQNSYGAGGDKYYEEYSILLTAIQANNMEVFKLCLEKFEVAINLSESYSCTGPKPLKTLLYFAMKHKRHEMVDLFLDRGAHFGDATYTKEALNHIVAFKTDTKTLLYQHLETHLPRVVVDIVADYLIPDYAPRSNLALH